MPVTIRKNLLRKTHKAYAKAGLLSTPEGVLLKQRWAALKREHANLRKSLANQKRQKAARAAERAFKKDPNKYAKRLFEGQRKQGSPTFSKEAAQEYFAKTYRDEERDYEYDHALA